jgi:hypothetical protein
MKQGDQGKETAAAAVRSEEIEELIDRSDYQTLHSER